MKDCRALDRFRDRHSEFLLWGWTAADTDMHEIGGFFRIPLPSSKRPFTVVASAGHTLHQALGWDHVSVSLPNRCPKWEEMDAIKRMFFHPHETAMQLHVPESEHISFHPYCLHLWRHIDDLIPLPPADFVGPKVPA